MGTTVLIVDDQSTGRAILEQIVRGLDSNVHIESFASPADAAHWATGRVADLVLVDFHMPEMDGVEFVRRLRVLPKYEHVPVVMVTVNDSRTVRYSALDAGVTDFLTKPIDSHEVLARCRNLLTMHRQQLILEDRGRLLEHMVQDATRDVHQRESHYRTVVETSPDGFWVLDVGGHILDVNEKYARRSGYSREELLTMTLFDIEAKQTPAEVRRNFATIRQCKGGIFEGWHRAKDGSIWPIEVSCVFLPDEGGRFCSFLRDITARKEAESALRQSDARFRAIIEALPIPCVVGDEQKTLLYLNTAFIQTFGYTLEDIPTLAHWWPKAFPDPTYQQWILATWYRRVQEAQKKNCGFEPLEINATCKNGQVRTVLAARVPLGASFAGTHVVTFYDITERKRAEAMKATLAAIVEHTNEAIIGHALDDAVIVWNAAAERMLGYTAAEAVSRAAKAALEPGEWQQAGAKRDLVRAGQAVPDRETVRIAKDGRRVDVSVSISPIKDDKGVVIGTTTLLRDITERKRAQEAMKLASLVYNNSIEAMMVTDANGTILTVNPAFTQITGYTPDEVIGKHPRFLQSGRHDEAFYQALRQELRATGTWQGEIWERRKNGEVFPKWLTINTTTGEDGSAIRRVALFYDLTERKKSEEIIWQHANFDSLTGLPNRRMFMDRLEQSIKKTRRAERPLALMFLDLDRFKEVNDTLGHDMGDFLLKEAARRVVSCVRETDTVARLGGDEFTIILGELDEVNSVERIAQNILRKLSEPFQLGGEQAYVSVSIGITLYPEDATETDALLKNADQAMYAAKNQGRNRRSYFTPSMQEAAQSRMRLAADLRGALADNQFIVHYQPIVELATGSILKAEALIRWRHPMRGLVSPADFIPIAEDTGMINEIGDWVFHEAVRQVAKWRPLFGDDFQISVNKSPIQFRSEGSSHGPWVDHLRTQGLPGQNIAVEITEGLLLEASAAVTDHLIGFRDAGIQVSLDDFGTAYSSLSYLKKFDIDYLKIDQIFVHNLAPGSEDMVLCEAIIVMAHKLGIKVVAEGVETIEQRDLLAAAGCDYAQGYLYSRPVPAETFEKLLSD